MAPEQRVRRRRARSSTGSIRAETRRKKSESHVSAANIETPNPNPADVGELRKLRLERLDRPPEEQREKMKYIGEVVQKVSVSKRDASGAQKDSEVRKRRKAPSVRKHSHQKIRPTMPKTESDEDEYVYGQKPNVKDDEEKTGKVRAASVAEGGIEPTQSTKSRRKVVAGDRNTREERRPLPRRQSEPVRRRNSYGIDVGTSDRSPLAPQDIAPPSMRKGVTSIRDRPQPAARRSTTIPRSAVGVPSGSSNNAPEHARKGSSILSLFMPPSATISEKKISCLTCGSDGVPISRSAKLACSHRMCHDCLKRIFNMSVLDPAHMPPRCCTSDHIPLKHVDKLFDQNFKKNWNRKFQEYNTHNRIYCPARGCGEWIKPNHITIDHGRKVGKCKRCNTRVCCTCNSKMHTSRECPKDPATIQLVEVAKQKGWQRCYKCKAMVELKEGCNHMTCRCTAEFCMVCGLKWKSCDCPWFNYETVDAHLGNPARYQEELDRRRLQEQRDEVLARRMEVLGVGEEDNHNNDGNDFIGLGNQAGHHMNDNFIQQARNVLTGNFHQARLAAEGLVNGTVTGRENPLPFLPLPPDQTPQLLRQQNQQRTDADVPLPAPLPRRHRTSRRQSGGLALWGDAAEPEPERRIQDWRTEVTVNAGGPNSG